MTINVGDRLPEASFFMATPEGNRKVSTSEIFDHRRVVVFAVPGAFTRTCHEQHLPGYLEHLDAILSSGVDVVACIAVNDVDVMNAWAKQSGADGRITFLADGNGEFTRRMGLQRDLSAYGMGERSKRYSMIVDNGVVTSLNVEDRPGVDRSGAAVILQQLNPATS
jgi:peroxiredoxin